MGGKGPNINDTFPAQEILWESFKTAMKDILEKEVSEFRTWKVDCRRCGPDRHKATACFARTASKGTKLPPTPNCLPKGHWLPEPKGPRTKSQGKRKRAHWQSRLALRRPSEPLPLRNRFGKKSPTQQTQTPIYQIFLKVALTSGK